MIELKELKNRFYVDGKPTAWDYYLDVEFGNEVFQIRYMYKKIDDLYEVKCIIPSMPVDSKVDTVYTGMFHPFKSDMPITLITAIGLSCIQNMLKEEIQLKSCVDFSIGDVIRGM